jgi:hypothetical protein
MPAQLPMATFRPIATFTGERREDLLVGDAAIQTLRRQHAEFGFGHVEPTAVARKNGCSIAR